MKKMLGLSFIFIICVTLYACVSDETIIDDFDGFLNEQDAPLSHRLLLDVKFDEGTGNDVIDHVSQQTLDAEYVFFDATDKSNETLRWIKDSAASGYALAFDGYSNKLKMSADDITISSSQLTVDVFVAPRMFEWDAPDSNEHIQTIVGQSDRDQKAGFVLGMHKYGDYTFQVGLDDRWLELWNEDMPLERYAWNHITAVFNGDDGIMQLYLNGVLINERNDAFGRIESCNNDLLIGSSQNPQMSGIFELNMFNGLMDELKIFDQAYSAEQVIENHEHYYVNNDIQTIDFEDAWLDRSVLDDDIYRPKFHANPPQHWMNEPHGLFQYNGYWHLFYQFNITGPYWRQIVWGHWVSEDMIHWIDVKEAVVMDDQSPVRDGAWSGGSTFLEDGTPVLVVTAGDDAKIYNHYSNQNAVIVKPKDLNDPYLVEWEVSDQLSAVQTSNMGRPNQFRDFNIYKEDGVYYMIATAGLNNNQGNAHILTAKNADLTAFEYQGVLFDFDDYPAYLGTSWELVNLCKVTNQARTISKYLFVLSPSGNNADNDVYYFLGDFDKEEFKFIPESEIPLRMDYGENVFTGPTIYVDELNDRVLISSIIQDQRTDEDHYLAGWAHNAGMPRELWLNDDGELIVLPIEEAYSAIGDSLFEVSNIQADILNRQLDMLALQTQTMFIRFEIERKDSSQFGLKFKIDNNGNYSSIYYDNETKEIVLDTRFSGNTNIARMVSHSMELTQQETLSLEIFIDHSMVEIYINGEKTITASIYNVGTGIEILSDANSLVHSLAMYDIKE